MENKPDLKLASSKAGSQLYYTIDVSNSGIEIGRNILHSEDDPREKFALVFPNYNTVNLITRKVPLELNGQANPALVKLEQKLAGLSERGLLGSSHFVMGVKYDPFHPFKERFDTTMKVLRIFKKYRPGLLSIQTRSPVVVIALDVLKALGENVEINLGIETCRDDVARALSPELPPPTERLRAALALKRFGVNVNIQISPLLPYGNWQTDAIKFAEILAKHSNRVYIDPFIIENRGNKRVLGTVISRSLLNHWGKVWIGEGSIEPLVSALNKIAPDRLSLPPRQKENKQLSMFVA